MINVVIPMAGAGSRFSQAGFTKPKPFIDVAGKPMIVRVLENMAFTDANYILVARNEHINAEIELVREIERGYKATFVPIDDLSEGTACTVLHARKLINNETPLLIANSDQIVDFVAQNFVDDCINRNLDGSILTFKDETRNRKWSFARIGESGLVEEVKEKEPISDNATVGIYLFRRGLDFIDSTIDMILNQDRVNGEYYTCPVYNYMIEKRMKIGIYDIPEKCMHGIGTPEDLQLYLKFHLR
jgi:NDP-sugar pyrophosphorylase family protein